MSIKSYFSLVKFSHTIFALPFSIIGLLHGFSDTKIPFDLYKLLFILICMVTARNAAMAFNRYLDRDIDEINERTFNREIPAGIIMPGSVLIFVVINSLVFIFASGMINQLCLVLSPVALLIVLGYSYTKRFTSLCHFILGLGLALAPVGAYLAISNSFTPNILFLAIGVMLWVSGFDIIYALQDTAFDKENKLNSIPVKMGLNKARRFSFVLHLLSLVSLIAYFILLHQSYETFGIISYIGLGGFCILVLYQHTLVNPLNLSKINADFFQTNGIGSLLLGLSVILDYCI